MKRKSPSPLPGENTLHMHKHKYPMHIILKSWKVVTVILRVYSLMEKIQGIQVA